MRVVEGTIGGISFRLRDDAQKRTDDAQNDRDAGTNDSNSEYNGSSEEDSQDSKKLIELLKKNEFFRDILSASIAINSTAFQEHEDGEVKRDRKDKSGKKGKNSKKDKNAKELKANSKDDHAQSVGEPKFVGNKTDSALLYFIEVSLANVKEQHYADIREEADIVLMLPFSSSRKAMATVVKLEDNKYRMYVKGAAEVLVGLCDKQAKLEGTEERETEPLDEDGQKAMQDLVEQYARRSLRTIALAYRDFDHWPPSDVGQAEAAEQREEGGGSKIQYDDIAKNLTLLAIPGIEDPLREGVKEAVDNCRIAGVQVKMCTGDNILTAK